VSDIKLSDFSDQALCADPTVDPEWWHPAREDKLGKRDVHYSYTPDGIRARNICLKCPVFDECLEYSLQFKDIDGIWANYDYHERIDIRKMRKIIPTRLVAPNLDIVRPSKYSYYEEE
jgi:hypothetical protein